MKATVVLIAALVWSAAATNPELIQEEKQNLQGTWKVVFAESRGEVAPQKEIDGMEIIFAGDTIQVREKGKVQERFKFKLDPTMTPRAIDFTFTEGKKKGRTDRGIYQIEGNNLKICIEENKDAPRPRDFATKEGSDLSLVVLKRFK